MINTVEIDWQAFRKDIKQLWPRRRDILYVIPIGSGTLQRFWSGSGQLPARFYLALCKVAKLDPFSYLKLG